MTDYKLLIGGQLVDGAGSIEVIDPATGTAFTHCPVADAAQLDAAVAAARGAFEQWAALAGEKRALCLKALAAGIEARAGDLAHLLTREQGKPLDQAAGEVAASAGVLRFFAGMDLSPRVLADDASGRLLEVRSPLGVVAAITPWNFPLILLMHKVAPALLAGNTIVVKPAPTTPLSTLLFGEICAEVLPAGVVNIVCDNNDLGALLTSHPDIAKIAFTGSTATGRKVMKSAANTLKRLTLELGGNDAAIVLDDADPIETAGRIFQYAMANAGQVCVAIKRAYVPEALYDRFCEELARLADNAVVGNGTEDGVEIGPVQNAAQFDKLKDLLASCREEGRIIAGGAAIDRPGYFIAPTIVRDVEDSARIVREEQFGPILPVLAYSDLNDAITRANDSDLGLGGSIWSADVDRAVGVAAQIRTGTVWINKHLEIDPRIPFRGVKQSGIGGELGREGLEEYTQPTIINALVPR